MMEIKERLNLIQKSDSPPSEMNQAPAEQLLVETLLPWWGKLVHRMVVSEEDLYGTKQSGGVEHDKDQRVAL
jgi:hypothetical protein